MFGSCHTAFDAMLFGADVNVLKFVDTMSYIVQVGYYLDVVMP
jgi:hypothetical protein